MPVFLLKARATLEGVDKFWVPPDHVWTIDVKSSAGSETREGVTIDPDEEAEVPNTKNETAHLVMKFTGEKKHSYLKIVEPKGLPPQKDRLLTPDQEGMVTLMAFECRGLEPVMWHPIGPYCVQVAEGGTVYDEVNFKDDEDWCEYDEKSGESMMVSKEIQHEFVLYKEKK